MHLIRIALCKKLHISQPPRRISRDQGLAKFRGCPENRCPPCQRSAQEYHPRSGTSSRTQRRGHMSRQVVKQRSRQDTPDPPAMLSRPLYWNCPFRSTITHGLFRMARLNQFGPAKRTPRASEWSRPVPSHLHDRCASEAASRTPAQCAHLSPHVRIHRPRESR